MSALITLFRRLFLSNNKDSYYSKYSDMRGTRGACRRPGHSDHLQRGWQHIGTGPYWESLAEWAAAAAGVWTHPRDVMKEPLQPNECICSRQDCVSGLYKMFVRKQRQTLTGGSTAVMQRWQRSPGGRYPSRTHQVICRCERCFNL